MMISKLIAHIHWNLTGSLMSQLMFTSHHLALLPSRSPLFPLSSSDLAFLSHFSQHPFLSSLFLPWVAVLPLHSFLRKWNFMFFLFHTSFHHFSPCLTSVSIDSHPPWNSFCILSPLWQEPVKLPRSVVAARPFPKKGHPTRGNGGDRGLERIIQGTSKSLLLRSPVLFSWYPGTGNRDYRVKTYYLLKTHNIGGFVLAVLFRPFITSGCWLLCLCNSENKGASANKDHREEGTQESWVGLKRMCG